MPEINSADSKLRVFISYSRRDEEFAQELVSGLELAGFQPYLDKHDIAAGEEWEIRLGRLIENADTVIFILSPEALKSERCAWEVERAEALKKRLLPVVWRGIATSEVPPRLERLNYIFFDKPHSFGPSLAALSVALKTDLGWIRELTRYSEAAIRWDARGRIEALLMRGEELAAAKEWLKAQPQYAPEPTLMTLDFIKAGENAEASHATAERKRIEQMAAAQADREKALNQAEEANRQRAKIRVTAFAVLAVAALLAGWQWWRAEQRTTEAVMARQSADSARKTADGERTRAQLSESRAIAAIAVQIVQAGDPITGLLLSLDVLPDEMVGSIRPYVPEAEVSLYRGLHERHELSLVGGPQPTIYGTVSAPDLAAVLATHSARAWRFFDAESARAIGGISNLPAKASTLVSRDAKRAVVTSAEATGALWDIASGKQLATIAAKSRVAFASDGSRLVAVSADGTSVILNATSGEEVGRLDGRVEAVKELLFTAKDTQIFTLSKTGAQLWDAQTGKATSSFTISDRASPLLLSPNGKVMLQWPNRTARAGPAAIRAYDTADGHLLFECKTASGAVDIIRFTPDGTRIIAFSSYMSHSNQVWNAETGAEIARYRVHSSFISSLVFSSDGKRALTSSLDDTARLWEVETGKEVAAFIGHTDYVKSARFDASENLVVTSSQDKTARIWDVKTGRQLRLLAGHFDEVVDARFTALGEVVVTASPDGTLRRWAVKSKPDVEERAGSEQPMRTQLFDASSWRTLVWRRPNFGIDIVDPAAGGKPPISLSGHTREVRSVEFSHALDKVVTTSDDNTIRIWEGSTGKEIAKYAIAGVSQAVFSPDDKKLLVGSYDKPTLVLDAASGQELFRNTEKLYFRDHLKFSADGKRLVTAMDGGKVSVLDSSTGQLEKSMAERSLAEAFFTADGRRIVGQPFWNSETVIWDAETGKQVARLKQGADDRSRVSTIALNPKGDMVATASFDGSVRLWSTDDGKLIAELPGHKNAVRKASFAMGGARLVTGSDDGTVKIWDVGLRREIASLQGEPGQVLMASMNADSTLVVTGFLKGPILQWRMFATTNEAIDHAKSVVPRCLTLKQRLAAYLQPEPPAWCIEMGKWPFNTVAWKTWLAEKRAGKNPPLPSAAGTQQSAQVQASSSSP